MFKKLAFFFFAKVIIIKYFHLTQLTIDFKTTGLPQLYNIKSVHTTDTSFPPCFKSSIFPAF